MSNAALSKPVTLSALRGENAERIATGFLLAWCLLPLAMVPVTLFYGASDEFVQAGLYIRSGLVSHYVNVAFRRAFLVLGSATIVFAALQVTLNRAIVFAKDNLKQNPWFFLLALLLVWAAVSTILSDNPLAQFRGTTYRCDGLYSYFIYAAVLCCALLMRDESRKQRLLVAFVAMADILCVFMLLEVMHVHPIWLMFQSPRAAVYGNLNHFGYVLCMACLCAAGLLLYGTSRKLRVFGGASFAFLVFALLVNDTFGCYLAVLVGLVAMLVFWVRSGRKLTVKQFAPLIVFMLLSIFNWCGGMAAITGGSVGKNFLQLFTDFNAIANDSPEAGKTGSGRLKLWIGALEMIPERPLFGFGPEGLTGDYAATFGLDRPHNELIQYAVFLGIPGLVLYVGALVLLAVQQLKKLREISAVAVIAIGVVAGYLASSLFGNTMFNATPYFWMMLGFAAWSPAGSVLCQASDGDMGKDLTASSHLSPFMRVCVALLAVIGIALVMVFGFVL